MKFSVVRAQLDASVNQADEEVETELVFHSKVKAEGLEEEL